MEDPKANNKKQREEQSKTTETTTENIGNKHLRNHRTKRKQSTEMHTLEATARTNTQDMAVLYTNARSPAPKSRGEQGCIRVEVEGGARVGGLCQAEVVGGKTGEPFGHTDRCDASNARLQTSGKELDLV